MDCRRCGAPLHDGIVLCPECGARQRRRVAAVRCASCHKSAPLSLTVCPHCGRDVRPAGPRWGLWLAGFIALVLFGLWGLDKLPIERAVQQAQDMRQRVSDLVQVLGPAVSAATPVMSAATEGPDLVALAPATPTAPAATPSATATPTPELVEEATATPEPELSENDAGETAAATPATETPQEPAATPSPTEPPTAAPTPTPTATPTATQLPPTATATPVPTQQAGGGTTTTYRVQPGDSLSSIAARFGITWEALAAANRLTSNSVLRIGQELIIPAPGATLPPTATPTPLPRPTATPVPPTPTPLPQLAAPALVNPADQASFSGGDAFAELVWQPAAGLTPQDQYQVVIRWTEQGAPQEHRWFTTAPGSRVPPWLWLRADQPARKYTWYVQVVWVTTDGMGGEQVIPLSPPSQARVFYWG